MVQCFWGRMRPCSIPTVLPSLTRNQSGPGYLYVVLQWVLGPQSLVTAS